MENKKFNLSLGDFGPYNKEILGAAHVADAKTGATFQIEMCPGIFRRKMMIANSVCDNGVKMWGANAPLTHFVYRYELEWKDQLYCDVHYIISHDRRCDILCEFVNNTSLPQTVNMSLIASLQRPFIRQGRMFVKFKSFVTPILPRGCVFRDAVDYDDILSDVTLARDGKYLAEVESDFATGTGTAVFGACFSAPEHNVTYRFEGVKTSLLGIRLSANEGGADMKVVVNEKDAYTLPLTASEGFAYYTLPIAPTEVTSIALHPAGTNAVIDSLIVGNGAAEAVFEPIENSTEPTERVVEDGVMTLRFAGIPHAYTVEWNEPVQILRSIGTRELESYLKNHLHNHVSTLLDDKGGRFYEQILSAPIAVAAGEKATYSYTVYAGEKVEREPIAPVYDIPRNPDGDAFAFSQNMLTYNTFLNVVYPIYTRRQYIKHNTPGRNWDCLYTWDSGFIGMGLGTADFARAYECLNTYLTPVGDIHSPFIFHGSVVPTQIFLYKYLFDKFPEHREELKSLFPMVMQYYRFFSRLCAEKHQMKSGLLKTWHVDYNSGGWDDYPAQHYIHMNTVENANAPSYENTTPVITTAVTVLISKILKKIAAAFGEPTAEYDECISRLSTALQSAPWDDEVGYFSYMVHDENGNPKDFLRAADGSNYNQGFDGIYPYVAGVTTDEQNAAIMDNIKNGLWSDVGICVVDKRASYYSTTGYWNGMVWMAHQWILSQALLDYGESDFSYKIAETALRIWKNEVGASYNCFEHFMGNGRGVGFHQFSGLSTPVLLFFDSYYKPGTLTVGFQTAVIAKEWNTDHSALHATLSVGGKAPVAIVCLAEGHEYAFTVNGKPVDVKKRTAGAYEIPLVAGEVTLTATAKN